MSRQFWSETLAAAVADGTAVANSTTETIIFPDLTIPANYMQDGRLLRLIAFGKLSTTGTPTITFALRWGGVAGTLLWQSDAMTTSTGSANTNWGIALLVQTRTNGATGSLIVMGQATISLTASTQTSGLVGVSGFDAPAPVTAALTSDKALSLTATWSAASASNTLTGLIYSVEALN